MTRAYCTLYDRNYLYQGLALYRSLQRQTSDFILYVLCMDDESFNLLRRMQGPGMVAVALSELMNPEVARIRSQTTHGQFCWVCQPLICRHVIDTRSVDMVTYLEADSYFFADPEKLFEELQGSSVSVVPHNYAPGFDNTEVAGEFCVQFNAFRNDSEGLATLESWREACFSYSKAAPRLYPGQTCLDEWPKKFPWVRIIQHPGAGVAPWNIQQYAIGMGKTGPTVNGADVIFYHFHQYARLQGGAHDLGGYPLSTAVLQGVYEPYIEELATIEGDVRRLDPLFRFRREYVASESLRELLTTGISMKRCRRYLDVLWRRLRGRYNVFPESYFSRRVVNS